MISKPDKTAKITEIPSWQDQVRGQIQRRYAQLAKNKVGVGGSDGLKKARRAGYPPDWLAHAPDAAIAVFSGCGFPFADLDLSQVRTVVDLGAGAGLDACLIAQRLAPGGRVFALDLTPAMLERVQVSFDGLGDGLGTGLNAGRVLPLAGDMERLPIADGGVDLVLANASFNLTLDKGAAYCEAARILRPGGRLAACDLILGGGLSADLRTDPQAWNTSLGGVIGEDEMHAFISRAGFDEVRIFGHQAFPPVTAVHIRATKSAG